MYIFHSNWILHVPLHIYTMTVTNFNAMLFKNIIECLRTYIIMAGPTEQKYVRTCVSGVSFQSVEELLNLNCG